VLATAVETPFAGGRAKSREATGTVVGDDTCRKRERGLAVGIPLTAEKEPAVGATNPERRAAVRAVVVGVEPLADSRRQRLAGVIDTQLEGRATFDPHLWEPTVRTAGVQYRRSGGQAVLFGTVETPDLAAGADERAGAKWTVADGNAGRGNRVVISFGRVVGANRELLIVGCRVEAEPLAVAFDGDLVGTGEPRDGLVAVGVVNEDGPVWFHENDDVAALGALAGAIEADGAVAGEDAGAIRHTPPWLRLAA